MHLNLEEINAPCPECWKQEIRESMVVKMFVVRGSETVIFQWVCPKGHRFDV